MPDQPAAAAATTTAGGDGLSKTLVGRAAYFSIYASDASGARATRGGEAFVVAIRGPSPATRSIRDNGDGTYTVTYCVACSGAYTVAVTLHGEPIRGEVASAARALAQVTRDVVGVLVVRILAWASFHIGEGIITYRK